MRRAQPKQNCRGGDFRVFGNGAQDRAGLFTGSLGGMLKPRSPRKPRVFLALPAPPVLV